MSETVYNQFHFTMNLLTWQDFQVLCFYYLKSINYNPRLGQISGKDKGQDIYGTGPNGSFIAHSTISKTKLRGKRGKLHNDVLNCVQKCLPLNTPRQELIFFSRKSVFGDPVEETKYIEQELMPELTEADPRYKNAVPLISLISGNQLIREIASLSDDSLAYKFLQSRVKKFFTATCASDDEVSLLEECYPSDFQCSENDFKDIVFKYDPSIQLELKEELLHDILQFSWNMIVFRPFFALTLLQSEEEIPIQLRVVLLPLCKIALCKPITSQEVNTFLSTLSSESFLIDGKSIHIHKVLVSRFVKCFFYQYTDILKENSVRKNLEFLALNGGEFWGLFFVDIYLRNVCNYLFLPDPIAATLKQVSLEYRSSHVANPISKLWPFLSTPIASSRKFTQEDFQNTIINIAQECQNTIECSWCLSALLRIMPLYSTSEDELDYVEMVRTLIEAFDSSIVINSPQLQYSYLNNLLRGFLRTKNLELLIQYEKQFSIRHGKLLPPQIIQLQMEFASSLYIVFQFKDVEDIALLQFWELIESKVTLIDHTLFTNYLVLNKPELKINPSLKDKRTVSLWLSKYSATLIRLYARPRIANNLLTAREYRASTRVYNNRPIFGTSVLSALKRSIKLYPKSNSSFYANSLRTFSLIPKNKNIELMFHYIKYALEADRYTVLRNSKDIGEAIFSCYYYSNPGMQSEVSILSDRFAELTDIGMGEAKLHWAYFAGVKYESNSIEHEFLKELGGHIARGREKVHQLALKHDEDVAVIFPYTVVEMIKRFAERSSLFAQALLSDMTNPDIWNIMGTTLVNAEKSREGDYLSIAATFYAYAKCFTRSRKDYDQKYCYNYIRCASLAHKHEMRIPSSDFISAVVLYLSRKQSKSFKFKEECTKPFFDLIEFYWNDISIDTRKTFTEVIGYIGWAKKELVSRQLQI